MRPPTRHLRGFAPWIVPLLILLAWEASSRLGWLSVRILPEPLAVATAFWNLLVSGSLVHDVAISTGRALGGLAIGGGLGLVLGLLTGTFRTAETLLDTTLQMIRNVPALALIPLVILWFGIDESAKLFLVAIGVFFPIYLNTYHGIRAVDAGLVEMARSYGLKGWPLYREVILPGALPNIFTGLRLGAGMALILVFITEIEATKAGLGFLLWEAFQLLETKDVFAGVVTFGLLGVATTWLLQWVERAACPWARR